MRWSTKKAYEALNRRQVEYEAAVREILAAMNDDVARAVERLGYDGSRPFRFSDYPQLKKQLNKWLTEFADNMVSTINASTSAEWKQSNAVQDALATAYLSLVTAQVHGQAAAVYYQTNGPALKAFQNRTESGMNLSQRLWNLTPDLQKEMEAAIGTAVQRGTSAITLSKQLSQYLHDFPSLKADYETKYGHATDIHDCEYRSARVARTEINMAYRTAEQERWRQMDFVLGKEIRLSGSHPCEDICDELAGNYPKDFEWAGWHPNCMCHEVPILRSEEDYLREKPQEPMIDDVPDAFKNWCKRNAGNIELAKQGKRSMPYFVRDNMELVNRLLQQRPAMTAASRRTPLQIAAARHAARTQEQIDAIKKRAEERQVMLRYADGTPFSAAQLDSFAKLEKKLGIKRGRPMTIEQADKQSANPNLYMDYRYQINCATCVPTFMLRMAGFDITAKSKMPGSTVEKLSQTRLDAEWKNADGTKPAMTTYRDWMGANRYRKMTPQRYRMFFENACKAPGFYEVDIAWKGRDSGHDTIIYRAPDGGLYNIEPQYYNRKQMLRSLDDLCGNGKVSELPKSFGVLRIDDKIFSVKYAGAFDVH